MDPTPGASLVSCERRVGEALDGGFLYAAATPLSLFGSLGIVKAGAAILCASFSPRAAKTLADAGFDLQGSIAVMIGKAPRDTNHGPAFESIHKDTKELAHHGQADLQYLAGQQFLQFLEEQHIDKTRVELVFNYYRWNFRLCICTFALACLSFTPGIRIMIQDHKSSSPPTWTYPMMRIVGSAISVVTAQMILQIRIQQILLTTLKNATEPGYRQNNAETGIVPCEQDNSWMHSIPLLWVLQALLLLGIGSTAVGYLGCFTVVQTASPTNTYIWLGAEVALAILRIIIWGSNPTWDEDTDVRLNLRFESTPPTITTGQDYEQFIAFKDYSEPFIIWSDSLFLDYVSPFTGPLERFSDPDRHLAIYYTLAGDFWRERWSTKYDEHKVLLTTLLDLETRDAYVVVHHCPSGSSQESPQETIAYSVIIEKIHDMGLTTAKYDTKLNKKHEFLKTQRFRDVDKHSRVLADRIGGIGLVRSLGLSWGLRSMFNPDRQDTLLPNPLTDRDREYLESQRPVFQWRMDFYAEKETQSQELRLRQTDNISPSDLTKFMLTMQHLLLEESIVFERLLLEKTAPSKDTANHLFYKHTRRLEVRKASDARNTAIAKRLAHHYQAVITIQKTGDSYMIFATNFVDNDVDDDTLTGVQTLSEILLACDDAWLKKLLTVEQKQAHDRLMMCGRSTSFNDCLARGIFAAYPWCSDQELLKMMIDQGRTVFDFSSWRLDPAPPPSLSTLNNNRGVQLLNCPDEWLPHLIQRAKSDRHILGITFEEQNGDPTLSTILAKNRLEWATNTVIPDGDDIIFWFWFSEGFTTDLGGSTMLTKREGLFRVSFIHYVGTEGVQATWRLDSTPDLSVVETEWIMNRGDDGFRLQHDSFTIDVRSPGIHQIEITLKVPETRFDYGFDYHLRKVWISLVPDGKDAEDDGDEGADFDEETDP
ncbi:hypothetical protein B0H19DRAFT_1323037 [Mycena capillaripes]|nr:hypothetical protein B0H19DRAFT_1323037 [Mycena capillaripes]